MSRSSELKTGFTTGAAAAAAVRGALGLLVTGREVLKVTIEFIGGGSRDVEIFSLEQESHTTAVCTVIKDAGDDPDVTHRAQIGARVTCELSDRPGLVITGGVGVGRVTRPGLEIPPGNPAINPGPRTMIASVVAEVTGDRACHVSVEIFVPRGEELAQKTLNPRLGILGGISILGTTGLVRPMSHEAYTATIRSALSVARAGGVSGPCLTTGRRSERFARDLLPDEPELAFVQIGDYFRFSLETVAGMGFSRVVLAVFFGKALKMAYGIAHTHAARTDLCLTTLGQWTRDMTGDETLAAAIRSANTAREAYFILTDTAPRVICRVGREMVRAAAGFAGPGVAVRGIMLDFSGSVVFDSEARYREDVA